MTKIMKINIPKIATKQLKLQKIKAGRKLVISSNWLPLFDFSSGVRVIEELIGVGQGIRIRLANKSDERAKLVYEREYKSRRNNPLFAKKEALMDIRGQKLLDKAFPKETQRVHITFKKGIIEIKPILNKVYDSISKFKNLAFPLVATLACSSGIDGFSLKENSFEISTLIEFRPNERRDSQDLSETGALNALANLDISYLFNEDIMDLDLDRLALLTENNFSSLYHISLQCDDHSTVKAKSLKDDSLDDLSTTLDMVIDCIDHVKKFMPPTFLLENVPGFKSSDAGKILKVRLRRLGYKVTDEIMDGRDYAQGKTSRKRYYMVATLLPFDFSMPQSSSRNGISIWDEYIEPYIVSGEAREVTHSKSMIAGLECGRLRLIERNSLFSPTILKSNDRMAKDSVCIRDSERDNKLYFLSNEMVTKLMGIPNEFTFDTTSRTMQSEQIGQSIEYPMHDMIVKEIKKHLLLAHARLNNRLF